MYVCTMCVSGTQGQRMSPVPRDWRLDDCEALHGCWELSLDSLQGQQLLLTTGVSLQPLPTTTHSIMAALDFPGLLRLKLFQFPRLSFIS